MKANREISGIRKEEKKKRRQEKRVNGRSIKGRWAVAAKVMPSELTCDA
jgi:hypothetical protein